MIVEADLDWDTSARAGAAGMFQVRSLTDPNGKDVTSWVDQGVHYRSIKDLEVEVSSAAGQPVQIVEI